MAKSLPLFSWVKLANQQVARAFERVDLFASQMMRAAVYVVQEGFSFLNADPDNWINKSLTPLKEGTIKMEVDGSK